MNTNRLWLIGAFVLIAVMLGGTWLIGVAPQLGAAATAASELTQVQALNAGHQRTLEELEQQYEHIDDLKAQVDDLRKEMPVEVDEAALLEEIGALAAANGVVVSNVTFDIPVVYAPGDSVDPEVVAASASVSNGNFFVVPMQMRVTGPNAGAFAFLKQLQNGTRLVLVSDLTVAGAEEGPIAQAVVLGITSEVFVLDNSAAVAPAAPVDGGTVAN